MPSEEFYNMIEANELALIKKRAQALVDLGRYEEAAGILLQALTRLPEDADLLCRTAYAYTFLKDWPAVLRYADAALAADPDRAWAHSLRCCALLPQKKYKLALKAAQEAVRLDPTTSPYLQNLTLSYYYCQRRRQAWETAQKLLEIAPASGSTYELLALLELQRFHARGAEAQCRKALSLNPVSPIAWSRLGRAVKWQGRTGEALGCFLEAAKIAPTEAYYRKNIESEIDGTVLFFGLYQTLTLILLFLIGGCFIPNMAAVRGISLAITALGSAGLYAFRPQTALRSLSGFHRLSPATQSEVCRMWKAKWVPLWLLALVCSIWFSSWFHGLIK